MIGIVVSRFGAEYTEGLLAGAKMLLAERNIPADQVRVFYAPGSFEIPLIAQTLAKSGPYKGVICLGAVIKGETAHFEFISLGAAMGLQMASLATGVPITFGILTTYTDEQARTRSRLGPENAGHMNKGREAAAACLDAIATLESVHARSGTSNLS